MYLPKAILCFVCTQIRSPESFQSVEANWSLQCQISSILVYSHTRIVCEACSNTQYCSLMSAVVALWLPNQRRLNIYNIVYEQQPRRNVHSCFMRKPVILIIIKHTQCFVRVSRLYRGGTLIFQACSQVDFVETLRLNQVDRMSIIVTKMKNQTLCSPRVNYHLRSTGTDSLYLQSCLGEHQNIRQASKLFITQSIN